MQPDGRYSRAEPAAPAPGATALSGPATGTHATLMALALRGNP